MDRRKCILFQIYPLKTLLEMDVLRKKMSFVVTRSIVKGLDDERTVENIDQCEDEDKSDVVNDSIETADTEHRDDIEVDKLSPTNADISKIQITDISL
ncbi:hypothetical protein ACJMK2_035105 [Sinanodonta woodiana]|uniref:Uncharacterized protein n=1 Tax=Sinanodonta woodiana TaxID=1069815 RepID=A0ABD3WTW6_SINWO